MKSSSPFLPLEDKNPHRETHVRQHKFIPFRFILPNMITILAMVSGLSSVSMALENRFDLAVVLLLVAALLDGFDGRIARALKGSSRFGEQLDSLADAINFGVVPALLAYIYILERVGKLGWLAALIYSVACCLRLARFNVLLDQDQKIEKWKKEYFIGVPSPGGGCLLLLPVYLGFLGMPIDDSMAMVFCFYTIFVAFLMICNIPVWSGKSIGSGLRRDVVIPTLLFVMVYFFLLVSYMWLTLTISTVIYFGFLPLSAYAYRRRARVEHNKSIMKSG